MTIDEAKEILKKHNLWRRDNDNIYKMVDIKILGEAIDTIVNTNVREVEIIESICINCFNNEVIVHNKEFNKETCVKCGFQWSTK
jgi:hypothetical protein